MGTRHLIAVWYKDEYRLSNYGQWDGYPSGQGLIVLNFLRRISDDIPGNREDFLSKLLLTKIYDEAKLNKFFKSIGVSTDGDEGGWMNMDQSKKFQKKYPQLSRDMGAKILDYILDHKHGVEVNSKDNVDFAADSLFCEWAYVLDFDSNELEVYKGFNKEPLRAAERFFHLTSKADGEYQPVRMVKAYKFNALPSDEEFVNELEKQEEEVS